MLQNLIAKQANSDSNRELADYQAKSKKIKKVKIVNEAGKVVTRALHRVEFQRVIVKRSDLIRMDAEDGCYNNNRFYHTDQRHFSDILNAFNNSPNQTVCELIRKNQLENKRHFFVCIGLANVRMRFCTRCADEAKYHDLERYYVDNNEHARHRTIFCQGCMGMCLIFHGENENASKEFQ